MARKSNWLNDRRRQAARRAKIQPSTSATHRLSASNSERHAVTNSHADLLLAIESTAVAAYQDDTGIDDRTVRDVLEALIKGSAPTAEHARLLYDALLMMREQGFRVADETWHSALRVIRDSVRTRSRCAPGDTNYLRYAQQFVRRASGG
jgi:hypothetical protein